MKSPLFLFLLSSVLIVQGASTLEKAIQNLDIRIVAKLLVTTKFTQSELLNARDAAHKTVETEKAKALWYKNYPGLLKLGVGAVCAAVGGRYLYEIKKYHATSSQDNESSFSELLSRLINAQFSKAREVCALSYSAQFSFAVPVPHLPLAMTAGAVGAAGVAMLGSGVHSFMNLKSRLSKAEAIRDLLASVQSAQS